MHFWCILRYFKCWYDDIYFGHYNFQIMWIGEQSKINTITFLKKNDSIALLLILLIQQDHFFKCQISIIFSSISKMDADYSKRLSHQQLMYCNSKIIVYENNYGFKKTSNVCFPQIKRQCISQRANRELKNCRFRQPLSTITRSTQNIKSQQAVSQSKQQIESVVILPSAQPSKVCGKQPFQPSNFKKLKKNEQKNISRTNSKHQTKNGKRDSQKIISQKKEVQPEKVQQISNKTQEQNIMPEANVQDNQLQMRIKLMRLYDPILLLQSDQKDLSNLDKLKTTVNIYEHGQSEINFIPYFQRKQQIVVRPSYLHMQLNKIRSQFTSKINKTLEKSSPIQQKQILETNSGYICQSVMNNSLKWQNGYNSLSNLNKDYTKLQSYLQNPNMNFFSTISGNFYQTNSTFHSKNSQYDMGSVYFDASERAPIIRRMQGYTNKLKLFPKHIIQNQEFIDQFFSPENVNIQNYNGNITWVRIPIRNEQTFQNNILFPDKITFPKIFLKVQNTYKDAPIFQMLNLLLFINSDIIKNIIQPSMAAQNSSYCCWLFQDGQFKPIIVDCAIPFNEETLQPIYAWTQGYMWCSILLKCIAKLLGQKQQTNGYNKLLNLTASQFYRLLTGFQMNRIKKQYISNKKDLGQQIICNLNKGMASVVLKQGEYSVIKNIKHDKIILFTPNKRDKVINLEDIMGQQYQLYLLKEQANWFIKQKEFPIQADSIYACQIRMQRHSKVHFVFNSIVKKIIIYEASSKSKTAVKMNLKLSVDKNYLEGSFRRGQYKLFLQFEKKDLAQYFKNTNSFQRPNIIKSSICKFTLISDQQIRLGQFQQLKSNAANMVESSENCYKVPKLKNSRKSKV